MAAIDSKFFLAGKQVGNQMQQQDNTVRSKIVGIIVGMPR